MVIVTILPLTAFADIIDENREIIYYDYQIVNIDEYPDYLIIAGSSIYGLDSAVPVVNGTFGGGYKLDGFKLYAINNTEVKTMDLTNDQGEFKNIAHGDYLRNLSMVVSDNTFNVAGSYEKDIGYDKIHVNLTILKLNDDVFEVNQTDRNVTFTNGTSIDSIFE